MPHAHLVAGDRTATFDDDRTYERRGRVVCLRKPDDTVLVHDAGGYQPVAWLTRPDASTVAGCCSTRRASTPGCPSPSPVPSSGRVLAAAHSSSGR